MIRLPIAVPRAIFVAALCPLLVLSWAACAAAHDRAATYSTWRVHASDAALDVESEAGAVPAETVVDATVHLSELDRTRLPDLSESGRFAEYVAESLALARDGTPCTRRGGVAETPASAGRLRYRWELSCRSQGLFRLRSKFLAGVAPGHLHFARVELAGGGSAETVLTEATPDWAFGSAESAGGAAEEPTFLAAIALGLAHIAGGYDHLLFLLALVLMERSLADVARVVTGFTVAHSLTLALSVAGGVRPPAFATEALIALSIVLLAAENLWLAARRSSDASGVAAAVLAWAIPALPAAATLLALAGWGRVPAAALAGLALFCWCYLRLARAVRRPALVRWNVAFVFGLVHGFGFAGFLVESAFSPRAMATVLLGFNVGVEIGQLAAVLLAWPLLVAAMRRSGGRFDRLVVEPLSAASLAAGLAWYVVRAHG